MPDRLRPPVARDCLDCGIQQGMKLQNAEDKIPTNIPLLYICKVCGCLFTVPPPVSPLSAIRERQE